MSYLNIENLLLPAPSSSDFFKKDFIASRVYPQELLENANKLLIKIELSKEDELRIEEVFDYLSDVGFEFLFPHILKAYLQGIFKLDGNFASKFEDAVWASELGNDRKYGRGNREDMFVRYRESLSEKNRLILDNITTQLYKINFDKS